MGLRIVDEAVFLLAGKTPRSEHGELLLPHAARSESLPSVTNVGTRPTVYDEHPRLVECHVLDFEGDLYGERVEL